MIWCEIRFRIKLQKIGSYYSKNLEEPDGVCKTRRQIYNVHYIYIYICISIYLSIYLYIYIYITGKASTNHSWSEVSEEYMKWNIKTLK